MRSSGRVEERGIRLICADTSALRGAGRRPVDVKAPSVVGELPSGRPDGSGGTTPVVTGRPPSGRRHLRTHRCQPNGPKTRAGARWHNRRIHRWRGPDHGRTGAGTGAATAGLCSRGRSGTLKVAVTPGSGASHIQPSDEYAEEPCHLCRPPPCPARQPPLVPEDCAMSECSPLAVLSVTAVACALLESNHA